MHRLRLGAPDRALHSEPLPAIFPGSAVEFSACAFRVLQGCSGQVNSGRLGEATSPK